MKKAIIIIFSIIIVLILSIGGFTYYFYNSKLNKINYEEVQKEEIEVTAGVEEKLKDYRNIVLFGIDDADGYKGRSDCIIIFSLNEKTNNVKMTSIYRDTYVEVPKHGYTKINHAYAYGGAALAMSTINKNLDLDITEYATINFEVVKDVVDYVGGVTLDITSKEATQIPGITKAGTYNLNGTQALAYGRIRKIDTDYKRTERMRTVINEVLKKVKKMSISEMNKFVDKILPELHTNIQKNEITELMKKVTSIEIRERIGWPDGVTGKIIDKIWYGIPNNLEDCVEKLHKEMFEEDEYEVSETVKNISNTIIKKTGVK